MFLSFGANNDADANTNWPAFRYPQYVILDSSSIHDLDSSSLKTLESLVALLVDRDPPIEMFLAPVSDPLMVQASL